MDGGPSRPRSGSGDDDDIIYVGTYYLPVVSPTGSMSTPSWPSSRPSPLQSPPPPQQSPARFMHIMCVICMDGVAVPPVATFCGHIFCEECLDQLVEMAGDDGAQCPTCRTALRMDLVRRLYFD